MLNLHDFRTILSAKEICVVIYARYKVKHLKRHVVKAACAHNTGIINQNVKSAVI